MVTSQEGILLCEMGSDATSILHQSVEEGYSSPAWHGPNLHASVQRVPVAEAIWRPGPKQYSIWEIAVHAAYWKYVVWRRLRGEKKGGFPRRGSDWFVCPPDGIGKRAMHDQWRTDLALLEETHRALCAAVAEVDPGEWQTPLAGSQVTRRALVSGVAAHDVYHAGQVQLIRRLYRAQS
jgi:hypothetical protein